MKKSSLGYMLTMGSIIILCRVQAQNTSPYWSLAGNSNASSSSKMGTTNNTNLRIITNNITRLFLNTNGNIGINTSAPRAPIHVNGLAKDTGLYSIAKKYGVIGVDTTTLLAGETYRRPNAAGVLGLGGSYGVYGESRRIGVYGLGSADPTSASATGIGVLGVTQYGEGVKGISEGTGVHGQGVYRGVYGYGSAYGVYGDAPYELTAFGESFGVYGKGIYGVKGNGVAFGIHGTSIDADTGRGVYGTGFYGVYGAGLEFGLYGKGKTGVYATTAASFNDAVRADAKGPAASWGIYATSLNSYGIYASSFAPGVYAGYFAGSIYSTGSYISSDKKLKKNIQPIENGLTIINKLAPKFYEYRHDGDFAVMNLPTGNQYGLIAQEVEQVLPELVKSTLLPVGKIRLTESKDTDNRIKKQEEMIEHKAINYTALIPLLIKATQELSETVSILQKENKSIKEELNRLKNGHAYNNFTATALLQNAPNPVKSSTTIGYSLPSSYSKAHINIADAAGHLVKQLKIAGSGKSSVQLNVSDISSGTYTYSLWIDDQLIATKQLLVVK
ncbi:MAG: hypothetical protein RL172_896 [Bacteroidota bacterium]|jgi:hypothetical protein